MYHCHCHDIVVCMVVTNLACLPGQNVITAFCDGKCDNATLGFTLHLSSSLLQNSRKKYPKFTTLIDN